MPEWLSRRAYLSPEAPALFFEGEIWTFAQLNRAAERAAVRLRAVLAERDRLTESERNESDGSCAAENGAAAGGVHAGDRDGSEIEVGAGGLQVAVGPRVAVLLPNTPAFVVLVHALAKAGAVLVPLNARLAPKEMAWQVRDADATVLIYDETYAEAARAVAEELGHAAPRLLNVSDLEGALPRRGEAAQTAPRRSVAPEPGGEPPGESWAELRTHVNPDAVHSVIYTSGTTGKPKGAMLTFGNHWWSAVGSALNLGLVPGDRWLACVPLFHMSGLSILLRSVIYGIPVILHRRFDPEAVNRAIDEEGVTLLSVVAAMLDRMLDDRGGKPYPPSLRAVLLGGGPAPEALLRRAMEAGMPVLQTYGLTETASQAATLAPADAPVKLGSAGKPLFATELRIAVEDERGDGGESGGEGGGNGRRWRWAEPGEAGEIVVRGPTVTPGYWRRPEATAEKFRDGWFHTGDVGYMDADGYLYVLDRREDMFVSGGENVYPAEIEAALREHPAVAEVGVVGVPDEKWGRAPAAAVVLRQGASVSAEELARFCRERLAGYKVPKRFAFLVELPRTASGKLLRRRLKELFRTGG